MKYIYKIKGSSFSRALLIIENKNNWKLIDIYFPYNYVILHFILLGYYFKNYTFFKFAGKFEEKNKQLTLNF